jgi:DNA (cytosine-5)-methyltransferase 1
MTAYYNENNAYCADWLENLIWAGEIAHGVVDRRSIEDVTPNDVKGFTQCHFFAGLGGWSRALRLAGFPDNRRVWTGSCPCQPFSQAGAEEGFLDERHLWPTFDWLIGQCRPDLIFGEQVAAKAALPWIDLVSTDLEAKGYTFGASDLCAAGIGAPHIRQRLYWVADALHIERGPIDEYRQNGRNRQNDGWQETHGQPGTRGEVLRVGDDDDEGLERRSLRASERSDQRALGAPSTISGFWADAEWVWCRDGKWRPFKSGAFPLVTGVRNRVGRISAYGNAIVPQVAAHFIETALEWIDPIEGIDY